LPWLPNRGKLRFGKEFDMGDFWLVFWWTGPIGIGIFLVCLATMIYLLAKADALNKKTKAGLTQHEEHVV
jgi:heme/copper-type cytochrome/quinol oxidase subunit 2